MIMKQMKTVIKVAIEQDIATICTYRGYKGAMVLRVSGETCPPLDKIEEFAKNMKLETKQSYDMSKKEHVLFVIFEHLDVYQIKTKDGRFS